jgi:hypothetical protein
LINFSGSVPVHSDTFKLPIYQNEAKIYNNKIIYFDDMCPFILWDTEEDSRRWMDGWRRK